MQNYYLPTLKDDPSVTSQNIWEDLVESLASHKSWCFFFYFCLHTFYPKIISVQYWANIELAFTIRDLSDQNIIAFVISIRLACFEASLKIIDSEVIGTA
jgi:hypothetical protein